MCHTFSSLLSYFSSKDSLSIKYLIEVFNILYNAGYNPFIPIISKKIIYDESKIKLVPTHQRLSSKTYLSSQFKFYSIFYYLDRFNWNKTEIYDLIVDFRTNIILSLVMNKKDMNHIQSAPTLKNLMLCIF